MVIPARPHYWGLSPHNSLTTEKKKKKNLQRRTLHHRTIWLCEGVRQLQYCCQHYHDFRHNFRSVGYSAGKHDKLHTSEFSVIIKNNVAMPENA